VGMVMHGPVGEIVIVGTWCDMGDVHGGYGT
jgi:hypothetical protein